MRLLDEPLPDRHHWLRIADPGWPDPLDATFAQQAGGRWNPPGSFPVLYLNEDLVTARINMRLFFEGKPYGPEDLREDAAPVLVTATLPRAQTVADVHTPDGVTAAGLPSNYPLDAAGSVVGHAPCQAVGVAAKAASLAGIRCRSAQATYGAGREVAWFPRTSRSRAHTVDVSAFSDWYWG